MSKVAIVFWSADRQHGNHGQLHREGAGANATIVPCAEMDAAKAGRV